MGHSSPTHTETKRPRGAQLPTSSPIMWGPASPRYFPEYQGPTLLVTRYIRYSLQILMTIYSFLRPASCFYHQRCTCQPHFHTPLSINGKHLPVKNTTCLQIPVRSGSPFSIVTTNSARRYRKRNTELR